MRLYVRVEHELRQRPLHPRQLAAQDGEAGAGHLRRRLEVELTQRFAQFEMLLRHKGVVARRPPSTDFDIVLFASADGHVIMRHVRQAREEGLERRVELARLLLAAFHAGLDLGDLGL